jgi:hypothetical protein
VTTTPDPSRQRVLDVMATYVSTTPGYYADVQDVCKIALEAMDERDDARRENSLERARSDDLRAKLAAQQPHASDAEIEAWRSMWQRRVEAGLEMGEDGELLEQCMEMIRRRSGSDGALREIDELLAAKPAVAAHYEKCGAWGCCPLPKGHNMGKADVPENHAKPAPADRVACGFEWEGESEAIVRRCSKPLGHTGNHGDWRVARGVLKQPAPAATPAAPAVGDPRLNGTDGDEMLRSWLRHGHNPLSDDSTEAVVAELCRRALAGKP